MYKKQRIRRHHTTTVESQRKQLKVLTYLFFGRFFFVNVVNCHLPMNKNTASMTAHQCTVIGTNYFLKVKLSLKLVRKKELVN